MKIAVILGMFSVGPRPLDFHYNNIWESTRGLTGTDLTTVMISSHLQKRGHDVYLFTVHAEPNNKPNMWEGVKLYNYNERLKIIDNSFDGIISINEPDSLRGLPTKPMRICWQFLNDFGYCMPGFDDYVDKWLGVCQKQVDYLKAQMPPSEKWGIVRLGCTPEWYEDKRVPGRVVWCSSADRGLHWLLQEWPKIKEAVPHATLKIFYHFGFDNLFQYDEEKPETIAQCIPEVRQIASELGQRIRYIKYAIENLKEHGVEHIGGISRKQMQKEYSEASVLGFSCDTVSFSEGFSISALEAHASFTVPIIADTDCLGEVYKNSGAIIIKNPIKDHLPDFTNAVIKALTDQKFSNSIIDKCRVFAMQNTWNDITCEIETVIKNKIK